MLAALCCNECNRLLIITPLQLHAMECLTLNFFADQQLPDLASFKESPPCHTQDEATLDLCIKSPVCFTTRNISTVALATKAGDGCALASGDDLLSAARRISRHPRGCAPPLDSLCKSSADLAQDLPYALFGAAPAVAHAAPRGRRSSRL